MALVELIPIGTFLALLTKEVFETALAAKDVLIEKESFRVLSKYLKDIEPVLTELQVRGLKDSQASRQALEFLKEDITNAKNLVEKYKNRARFYLLVKCRHIVKEVQDVTRDIGRSMAALSLASGDILSDISEKVNKLHSEMQKAEFEASQAQLRIVEKLDQGIQEQKSDQSFANDILEEIARAVGVPIEPSEISKELENFRREKEEAAEQKEQMEVLFLEQVIKLLSRADAANDLEEIKAQYDRRLQTIEKYKQDEYIPPLKTFICPIEKAAVMVDPVNLCTGTTCERAAIETWFESGQRTDPETGQFLDDLTLISNVRLRQSIEEWRELNYCLKIRSAKAKLLSGVGTAAEEALNQLLELIKENSINKDWIAIEGIIEIIVSLLGSAHNRHIRKGILVTLKAIIDGRARNKDRVVESGGVDHIIHCLGRDYNTSKAAVELLFELLQDGSEWNLCLLNKVAQHSSTILFLVMLLKGPIKESAEKAEEILLKLCHDDDENISRVATCDWFKPLITRLCQGTESSRISMAEVLVKMELVEQNIKLLGAEGAIPPLAEMVSRNLESKRWGFAALAKLATCYENKELIASTGVVPLILEQVFSPHVPTYIRVSCAEILERLCSGDGVEFLVDGNGNRLDIEPIVNNLISLHEIPVSCSGIRLPALHALLEIYKSEIGPAEAAVASTNGVSIILPLLDDPDSEIREVVVNLLFHFSKQEPQGIADFLLIQGRLEAFVAMLEDVNHRDLQMAAVGLLSHLPKSEMELTNRLVELNVLQAIFDILRFGTEEAKENALGALFRFTDSESVEMQQKVVELEAYPLLLTFIKSGSVTAKERAVALIGNLSSSTPKLVRPPKPTGFCCFRSSSVPLCEVHDGICSVKTTFCLYKANALPELVKVLRGHSLEIAYEALQALATMFSEGSSYRVANVLHQADAICPMLELLDWGTPALKEEVLTVLEKVFALKELADIYHSKARIPLFNLTTQSHQGEVLGGKAARVLAQIERYSRSINLA